MGRRQVVQAGAAAAVAAPLLRPKEAEAAGVFDNVRINVPLGSRFSLPYDKSPQTPVITIMDHRGCNAHENTEYRGKKAEGPEDEMLVMIKSVKTKADEGKAATFLSEALSFTAKGIDGTYSQVSKTYI